MAIQGSLEEAPLPDVVQLLTLGKKTGRLSLTEGAMRGEIYLDHGRVCYAFVASRRDRMGDMLVRTGRITRRELNDAIAEHQSGSKRVSQILLESGRVERSELERFFEAQVAEAVYFMFTWRTGTFRFESGARPDQRDLIASIDPESLLLEGARRVDEWSVIEKKIPTFDLVFRLDRPRLAASSVELTSEQKHVLPLIDGARDVAGIIELAGLAEFDVGKALYGLIAAGFAHLVERRAAVRHLEYGELLAYVLREGEYADADHRRAAARHIADCGSCTARLKTIHVRRTGAISTATLPPDLTAPVPAVTAPEPPEVSDRRSGDRRSVGDRRAGDRRSGDRRRVRSPEWERPGVERRSGAERRSGERRISERRLLAVGGGSPVMLAGAGDHLGAQRRTTGPRRVRMEDVGGPMLDGGSSPAAPSSSKAGRRRSGRAASRRTGTPLRLERSEGHEPSAPAEPSAAAPTSPPVEADHPDTPAHADDAAADRPAAATTPPPAKPRVVRDPEVPEPPADGAPAEESRETRPLPAKIRTNPRPQPWRPGARSKNIEWLVSPDEADHLLRTSRAEIPPPPAPSPPRPADPKTDQPPAPRSEPRPAAVTQPAIRPPMPPAPAPPPAPPAVTRPAAAAAAPPTPRPAQAAAAAPLDAPRAEPATAVPGRSRWVPVAIAGIVGIAIGSVAVPRLFQQPADEPAGIVEQVAAAPAPDTAVTAAEEPPPPTPTPEPEERAAPVTPSPTPPRTVEPRQAAAPATERVRDTVRTAPVQQTPVAERPPATDPVAAARPVVTPAPSPPPPTVATVRGTVRDGVSGAPLGGVAVSIPGTAFAVRTDASGGFELPDVPAGQVQVRAELTGRPATTRDLSVTAGVDARLDLTIAGVPKARTPDDELAAGGWTVADLAAATDLLGMPIAVIPGLTVESIATPSDGGRPRVRVAQLTASGERIVLTETRSGAPVPSSNPRVTALRVIPASPSYPVTTGTASFGNLLVTAKAEMDGGELRELLAKLVVAGASD